MELLSHKLPVLASDYLLCVYSYFPCRFLKLLLILLLRFICIIISPVLYVAVVLFSLVVSVNSHDKNCGYYLCC